MEKTDLQPGQLINLSSLIEQIKSDLLQNPSKNPLFFIDEIEVTAQIVATKSHQANGGVEVSILSFGLNGNINGQIDKEHTQLVKVKLSPLLTKEEFLENLPKEEKEKLFQNTNEIIYRGEDFS